MTSNESGVQEKEGKSEVAKGTNKSKIQDDFKAPDGGWGWMIVLAAGFSNFCLFPMIQAFGLLFRDRFIQLGINSSKTTTLLNVNCAVTSCIGLINGPLFRKYSYRQVSLAGAFICAISVTMLSTMHTFAGILVFFSILYAAGLGIALSSNALALNTYFKEKRRIATGLSWTCTGMGPIVMPQIITLLMPIFGTDGTVLIYGGLAFNAVACALLLQPVTWHTKKKKDLEAAEDKLLQLTNEHTLKDEPYKKSMESVTECRKSVTHTLSQSKQKFGSQYLYYDDDDDGATGIDVMSPATPMMSQANDGWYSKRNTSNNSLVSRTSKKVASRRPSANLSRPTSLMLLNREPSTKIFDRQTSETESLRRKVSISQATPLSVDSECFTKLEDQNGNGLEDGNDVDKMTPNGVINEAEAKKPWYRKVFHAIIIFFDLDLLRDRVYVNLMMGITMANFSEMNFAMMTPFILGEYGFTKGQVATTMSILAGVDVGARLTIPFIATPIGWDNRTFFLVGVSAMAAGRIVLAHVKTYEVALAVAVLIGSGKALRTIFMALVIPTHVPLSRLPAATGLQLLASGLFSLTVGPIVGWIRDSTGNYAIMLHFLNIFTYLTIISWTLEDHLRKRRAQKQSDKSKEIKASVNA